MSIASNNIFGKDGFFWWIGVVEDRMDPMLLGRCRVRIIGYHTDKQSELPTDELPWAIPMQGITSAAISGKGDAPLGPLEGTWVIGFFADGKDCQQPIVMGTLGGLPGKSPACLASETKLSNVLRDSAGNVLTDADGNPIPNLPTEVSPDATASGSIRTDMPPLAQTDLQTVMDTVATEASGSDPEGEQKYGDESDEGYVGKYHFKANTLKDNGFLTGPLDSERTEADLVKDSIWTGKNGINSLEDFKANKNNCQELLMYDQTYDNYQGLLERGVITTESPKSTVAGYLTAAHFTDVGTAADLKNGSDVANEVGIRTTEYFNAGSKALGGGDADALLKDAATEGIPPVPADYAGALNNPKIGNPAGFGDPNSKYPNCNYSNRQDTNKLASNNDAMDTTILGTKSKSRITTIPTANGKNGAKWEEPPSAFQGKYPYNKVKETESGHVVELDDTPGAERIHIYHRTGTYVEIDKNGSVRQKVMGENYEIYTRNDNVYVQGNMNVTVDGAEALLVKGTVDVEILGKTTVNIKNDADLNIAGNFNIIAQNINMQARQDINITANNYMNVKTGGDINYTIAGDEHHKVAGSFDLDAITVAINSGTAIPFSAAVNPLSAGKALTNVADNLKSPTSFLSKLKLPAAISNPLNSISKAMSGLVGGLGGITGGNSILNKFSLNGLTGNASLGNLLGGVGAAVGGLGVATQLFNKGGLPGIDSVLGKAGLGSLTSVLGKAGLPGINVQDILNKTGMSGLNDVIKKANLGSLDDVLKKAGVNLASLSPGSNTSLNNLLGGISSVVGGVGAAGALANILGKTGGNALLGLGGLTGGAGNILQIGGVKGLNEVLSKANLGTLDSIIKKAGISNIGNVDSILKTSGIDGLNGLLKKAGAGNIDNLLKNAGLNLQGLTGNTLGPAANALVSGITNSGVLPKQLIDQGRNLTGSFFKNGATAFSMALPVVVASRKVNRTEFKDWSYFPAVTKLSKNFDLGRLSTHVAEPNLQFPVMTQAGLTKSEIVTNLKALSVNVLDPIFDRYPTAEVTDAFRPMNSYLAEVTVNNPIKDLMQAAKDIAGIEGAFTVQQLLDTPSQHNLGQAANVQFAGLPAAEYYTVAEWIRDNVAYDQLRLEYTTLGTKEPFITVTHNPDGNRPADAIDKIVTCMNGEIIANFLVDMTSVA